MATQMRAAAAPSQNFGSQVPTRIAFPTIVVVMTIAMTLNILTIAGCLAISSSSIESSVMREQMALTPRLRQ